MEDVRDIMDSVQEYSPAYMDKKLKKKDMIFKKPEGMHRELYALLTAEGVKNIDYSPLFPSEGPGGGGYKQKVKLGAKKVRCWKWTPFTNPARKDGFVLHHWRRVNEENKEYPFAKFNKEVTIQKYSESEYTNHLEKDGWSKEETDHLFELCKRFDLRFPIIQDRWEMGKRSMEDLKERYYSVTNILNQLRAEPGQEVPTINFDADHERKRKEQLNRLYNRTKEQIEEEDSLRAEMKKIEARKKDREKKTQDLQKLITAADGAAPPLESAKKSGESKKSAKKKSLSSRKDSSSGSEVFSAIKWPEFRTAGVFIRSQKIKLPGSVGQKKMKVIEQVLNQLQVDLMPGPTAEITQQFNDLRQDVVLLYEIKSALTTCEMEIQSLRSQFSVLTNEKLEVPDLSFGRLKIDVADGRVGDAHPLAKKRKAALEQGNILRKLKNKV